MATLYKKSLHGYKVVHLVVLNYIISVIGIILVISKKGYVQS